MRRILAILSACTVTCSSLCAAAERPAVAFDFESDGLQGWRIVEGEFHRQAVDVPPAGWGCIALDDVRAEAETVFQQLLAGLHDISDEELINPLCFRDMPADWQPWKIIADNSFDHYRDHGAQIRAWRERLQGT